MMKKPLLVLSLLFTICWSSAFSQTKLLGGRMKEIFRVDTIVPPSAGLQDPWEVTFGPSDSLWVTEAKGYKLRIVNRNTGGNRVLLDLTNGSQPAAFIKNYTVAGAGKDPQGGLMGLAVHPQFSTTAKKYVYVAYIKDFVANNGAANVKKGWIFRTVVVRFTYEGGVLGSPVALCDTIPGGDDHNSGRMIIAPVNGVDYLFYAVGDMGAGQFGGVARENKAQNANAYEGKILRFNLENDGEGGLDGWIPNDNPYNNNIPGKQSAVWSIGIRNNQGFAYANINGVDRIYGASHGPFSDDELNIIEKKKNYGHPLVVGYNDGNYDGSRAGQIQYNPTDMNPANRVASVMPIIVSENSNVNAINAANPDSYRDPIYSFYDTAKGSTAIVNSIAYIYNNTSSAYDLNANWASEAFSGMGIYTDNRIPGWKNSVLLGSLKRGRVVRMKLNAAGTNIIPSGYNSATGKYLDTVSYFNSTNKFRDLAVDTSGRDFYVSIDVSPTTSGPGASNPIVSACAGCIEKFSFLGYRKLNAASLFRSTLDTIVGISLPAVNNTCTPNPVAIINTDNDSLWVPITGQDGDIVAEVLANPSALTVNPNPMGGVIYSSVYKNSGTVRTANTKKYLDRNITITPGIQPTGNVKIRLYITTAEYLALKNAAGSGVSVPGDMKIIKNADVCGPAIASSTVAVTTDYVDTWGTKGYVVGGTVSSFSTFFISGSLITLPVNLLSFNGALVDDNTELRWETSGERNLSRYAVERSLNSADFTEVGSVGAVGATENHIYTYGDLNVTQMTVPTLYYRLKMIDIDGNSKYSNIISISLAASKSRVTVLPNPVADIANVSISSQQTGTIQWKLIDNAGHTVMSSTHFVIRGKNTMNINTAKLKSGLYYLSVTGAGLDQKVKVLK